MSGGGAFPRPFLEFPPRSPERSPGSGLEEHCARRYRPVLYREKSIRNTYRRWGGVGWKAGGRGRRQEGMQSQGEWKEESEEEIG